MVKTLKTSKQKNKFIRTRTKKQDKQDKQDRQDKQDKQDKHSFFIVDCDINKLITLDYKILYKYLERLGVKPDYKAMLNVKKQYDSSRAKYKLSKKEFCENTDRKITHISLPNNFVHADVIFYSMNLVYLDLPFYKYYKFLSNYLNIGSKLNSILDKESIFQNVLKYGKVDKKNNDILKHFIETFPLSEGYKFKYPETYILRPLNAFGGKDIFYIQNKKEEHNAIEYYKSHVGTNNKPYKLDEIMVSILITDLLLFRERKFHLRFYFIVAILEDELSSFILDIAQIITAKAKYNTDLPLVKDVHDTHFGSTDVVYYFPKALDIASNDKAKIISGINKIAKVLTNVIINSCDGNPRKILFENQKNGYHIFGFDIFVKSNCDVVLIECNRRPGFGSKDLEGNKFLSKTIFGWLNETVLEPLFKHPGRATEYARKHKTYIPLD